MSKGKGQQAMEHNWFPLEFQLPDGKDTLQTAQKCYQCYKNVYKITNSRRKEVQLAELSKLAFVAKVTAFLWQKKLFRNTLLLTASMYEPFGNI